MIQKDIVITSHAPGEDAFFVENISPLSTLNGNPTISRELNGYTVSGCDDIKGCFSLVLHVPPTSTPITNFGFRRHEETRNNKNTLTF
jgi:hypothetical protein